MNPSNLVNVNPKLTSTEIWILHNVYSVFKIIILSHYNLITLLISHRLWSIFIFFIFHHFQIFWRHFLFLKISFFSKKIEKYFFKINILGSFLPNFDFFRIWPPKKNKKTFLTLGLLRQDSNPRCCVHQGIHSTSKPNWHDASIIS